MIIIVMKIFECRVKFMLLYKLVLLKLWTVNPNPFFSFSFFNLFHIDTESTTIHLGSSELINLWPWNSICDQHSFSLPKSFCSILFDL